MESKNKEIMSSINYAKRIQRAILPEEDLIQNFFSEHFIFYHPKDIDRQEKQNEFYSTI